MQALCVSSQGYSDIYVQYFRKDRHQVGCTILEYQVHIMILSHAFETIETRVVDFLTSRASITEMIWQFGIC